jgi:MFS family permease
MNMESEIKPKADDSSTMMNASLRAVIMFTCANIFSYQAFSNGIVLLYLKALGISEARLLVYITIPAFFLTVFRIPIAFFADSVGKKKLGYIGIITGFIGFLVIFSASFAPPGINELVVVGGILLFSCGAVVTSAGWFALLDGVIHKDIRGRFFGKMRQSWQMTGVVFSGVVSWLMMLVPGIGAFRIILGIISFFAFIRLFLYMRIPEVVKPRPPRKGAFAILLDIVRSDGVASFGAYVFLLTFFTSNAPSLFSLTEKEFIGLSNSFVVALATLTLIGSITGYWLGGQAVDRFGTKPVFMICHLSYPAVFAIYIFRSVFPVSILPSLIIAHFLFGMVIASASIAITTEMLALLPKNDKSVASSLLVSFQLGGGAAAGFVCAGIVRMAFLKSTWTFHLLELNKYDTILLGCAVMVLMLVLTLGLVPSVLRGKSESLPALR